MYTWFNSIMLALGKIGYFNTFWVLEVHQCPSFLYVKFYVDDNTAPVLGVFKVVTNCILSGVFPVQTCHLHTIANGNLFN